MVRKEKPLSPHISIYKPQISSVLSISHRLCGVLSFIGITFMMWWVLYMAYYSHSYSNSIVYSFFSSVVGQLVLICWSFSFFLHFCTGIRYIFWDAGYGFSLPVMAKSGLAAVFTAFFLTSLVWLIYYLGL